MRSRELKRMLAEASKLTPTQRQELIWVLSDLDEAEQVVQTVQSRPQVCPHCQGERVVRNGHASGLQRYKCRNCARTFNSLTRRRWLGFGTRGNGSAKPKCCARA
jgi:transposase-like protein